MSDHDNKPQQDGATWLDSMVSGFKTAETNRPAKVLPLREFLDGIRSDRWKAHVEDSRNVFRNEGEKAYKSYRSANVPAVTLSGTFPRRHIEGLEQHSGVLGLDFDRLGERLDEVRNALVRDEHVLV